MHYKEYFLKMGQLLIFQVVWYLAIIGVFTERKVSAQNSFLEKQHDYTLAFERVETVRYDQRYIKSLNIVTFKYNRTWAVVNASHVYNIDVGKNLEVICDSYRFASNEYRSFPMRFQFNFCQAVDKNVMGVGDFRRCGTFTGCPLVKNKTYSICNWSPDANMFPPFIPNGQYMLEFQMVYSSMELFVIRAYGTISRPIRVSE